MKVNTIGYTTFSQNTLKCYETHAASNTTVDLIIALSLWYYDNHTTGFRRTGGAFFGSGEGHIYSLDVSASGQIMGAVRQQNSSHNDDVGIICLGNYNNYHNFLDLYNMQSRFGLFVLSPSMIRSLISCWEC